MDPSEAIREAETLWNMGRLDEEISLDVAQRRYEQALALVEPLLETGPDALRVAATVHHELADVYRQREDFQRFEEHAEKALELREAFAPDSLSAANDHHFLAYAAALRGDHETGLRHYTRALEIAEPEYPQSASAFEIGVADCHLHLGELDRAARHYRAALEHARRSGKPEVVAAALNNLGTVTRARGDLEQALEYHEGAYDALADVGPTSLQAAMIIQQIAVDQHARGDLERALRTFQRSASLSQRHAPGTMRVASVLLDLGEAQVDDGRADEAVESYRSALEIFDRMGTSSPASVKTRLRLGAALLAMGRPRDALGELLPALELEEGAAPGSQDLIRGFTDAGLARRALGEDDLAVGLFKHAVDLAEGLRARAGGERAREQVFALQQSPYQALIGCLARRRAEGDDRLAFDYAERARARNLADLLVERDLDLQPENEEQARLLAKERELRSRIAALYNRMAAARAAGRAAAKELDELAQEQRSAREELEGVLMQLRDPDTGFRTYAELRYPEPLTLSQVQALLDEDTLLLSYTTADEELLLFAARRDALELVPLGVPTGTLEELIEKAIGSYRRCEDAGAESDGARSELSRLLLSPVPARLLERVERLVIVPDGAAFYLPFELLPLDGGVLLGERYVTSYAPSATVLGALASTKPTSGAARFVGFGDPVFTTSEDDEDGSAAHAFRSGGRALPALPGTRRELERIRGAFGSGGAILRLGADATEHRIKSESNGYRFVHFATHGLLDDRDPLYSGLAVSPPASGEPDDGDDFLQTYELFGLPLRETELVVLSCCQTGLGRIQTGEGLVGMTRALFFAGARCVVVSLWPVPDLPTARLMERFYGFLAEGDGPALALKRAKESVRESHPAVYRDAASWAAFIPVGLGW